MWTSSSSAARWRSSARRSLSRATSRKGEPAPRDVRVWQSACTRACSRDADGRTCSALSRLQEDEAHLRPTRPTTVVTASFAIGLDPGGSRCAIGFASAGHRKHDHRSSPRFNRSEFLLEKGWLDLLVDRHEMRIGSRISSTTARTRTSRSGTRASRSRRDSERARRPNRRSERRLRSARRSGCDPVEAVLEGAESSVQRIREAVRPEVDARLLRGVVHGHAPAPAAGVGAAARVDEPRCSASPDGFAAAGVISRTGEGACVDDAGEAASPGGCRRRCPARLTVLGETVEQAPTSVRSSPRLS